MLLTYIADILLGEKMIFRKTNQAIARIIIGAMFVAGLSVSTVAQAEKITVTDVAGRTVSVERGVKRVILGEGRMMYSVGILDKEAPFQRIIGWKDDLIKYDPDAFRKYQEKFPEETKKIKNFGSPYAGDFSIESAIGLKTDLVILNLGNLYKAQETGVLKKLEKAGIPVIFIDYRIRPTQNTVPSFLLMGRVFNKEKEAQAFVDFYVQQMRKVTNVVSGYSLEDRPLVFLENAAGYRSPEFCCNTFGGANYGKFIDEAGGINWGTRLFPGFKSDVSFEALLGEDPDIIVGTGANWIEAKPDVISVLLGYEANEKAIQEKLVGLSKRKGWGTLKAVKNKRFYSIYHQFYNSPYHFVALQVLAKWFHPEDFKDLDPEATFKQVHDDFLAIDYSGKFWGQLK